MHTLYFNVRFIFWFFLLFSFFFFKFRDRNGQTTPEKHVNDEVMLFTYKGQAIIDNIQTRTLLKEK